jgi:hypothetical protein
MTLGAISQDPWASVQLPLPQDATLKLLIAARAAARMCVDNAGHIVRTHDTEDADSIGYAMEMQFMERQAYDRINQINGRLEGTRIGRPARAHDLG